MVSLFFLVAGWKYQVANVSGSSLVKVWDDRAEGCELKFQDHQADTAGSLSKLQKGCFLCFS